MKATDLREKSVDDLRELQRSLASDVFQNRLKNFTNRLDDTSAIRKTRRELARVMTLLHETDLGLVKTSAPKKEAPRAEEKAAAKEAPKAEAKAKKAATKKAASSALAGETAAESKPKKTTAKKSEAKKS